VIALLSQLIVLLVSVATAEFFSASEVLSTFPNPTLAFVCECGEGANEEGLLAI